MIIDGVAVANQSYTDEYSVRHMGTIVFAVVTDFDRNCLLGKGVLVVAYHTPVVIYDILG